MSFNWQCNRVFLNKQQPLFNFIYINTSRYPFHFIESHPIASKNPSNSLPLTLESQKGILIDLNQRGRGPVSTKQSSVARTIKADCLLFRSSKLSPCISHSRVYTRSLSLTRALCTMFTLPRQTRQIQLADIRTAAREREHAHT